MEKSKTKKKAETRKEVSPKKERKETKLKTIVEKTDGDADDKSKTKINEKSKSKEKEKMRMTSIDKFPKNYNEFRHILDTFKISRKDLEWTLDLRTYVKNSSPCPKTNSINPPQLTNFDAHSKKNTWDLKYKGNSKDIEHLIKNRMGGNSNFSQTEFETNLRNYKSEKGNTKLIWNSTPYYDKLKTMTSSFLPPMNKENRKNLSKLEKYVVRPVDFKITKEDFLSHPTVMKKTVAKNETSAMLGEHYGLTLYDDTYNDPNFNTTRHILCSTANNSTSKWTCGLRGESASGKRKPRPATEKSRPKRLEK